MYCVVGKRGIAGGEGRGGEVEIGRGGGGGNGSVVDPILCTVGCLIQLYGL